MRPEKERRARAPVTPDINVTPLVDVVLVLLIIFMVVTPQMQKGPAIETPGVENPDPKTEVRVEPVVLKLDAKGVLYLDDAPVERAVMAKALAEIHEKTPDRRVVIKADKAARYADVRGLFKEAQEVGFQGVALEVGEKNKGG